MSKNKKIIAVALLLVLVIGAVAAYFCFRPEANAGEKTVVLSVVHLDGSVNDFTMETQAESLADAMREIDIIDGENSEYGLFVTTVDGETADSSQEQWWCFTKDGEMLMTGVDQTMIGDGEHYEATLTVGYDSF